MIPVTHEFASEFDLPIVQVIAESLYDQENPPKKANKTLIEMS